MDDSTQNIESNKKILQIFARHDVLVIVFALGGIYVFNFFIGLAFTIIPILEFIAGYSRTKKLPSGLEKEIKQQHPSSEKVIFRNSGEEASQAFSLPFIKMVFVSQEHIDAYLSRRKFNVNHVNAIIAHELGHLDQFDRMTIRWLQATFWLYVITAIFLFYIDIIVPVSINWRFIYSPGVVHTIVTLCVMFFIFRTLFHRVAHRREHIADLNALKTNKDIFLDFLSYGIRSENRRKPFGSVNDVTHPPFFNRYGVATSEVTASVVHARQISFQWFALFFIFDSFHAGDDWYFIFYFLMSVFFMSTLIWTLINLTISGASKKTINSIIIQYSIGLIIGFIFSYSYIFMIEHLSQAYPWEWNPIHYKFSITAGVSLATFILSAYVSFLLFNILKEKIVIPHTFFVVFSTTIIFIVSFLAAIDINATKTLLEEFVSERWPADEYKILSQCKKKFEGLNDESKLECLYLEKKIFTQQLESLRKAAIKKIQEENPRTRDLFPGYEPYPPFLPVNPATEAKNLQATTEEIRVHIKKWEKTTKKNFLENHPSMKPIDIPEGGITLQPLPSISNPEVKYGGNDPSYISISNLACCFDRIMWSSEEGVCWYRKYGMFRPDKVYCGSTYRQWMTDLYNAKSNLGEFSPHIYIRIIEYNLLMKLNKEMYEEQLRKYETNIEEFKIRKAKGNELIENEIKNEKREILLQLEKLEEKISSLTN